MKFEGFGFGIVAVNAQVVARPYVAVGAGRPGRYRYRSGRRRKAGRTSVGGSPGVVARAVGCEEGQGYYFGRPLPVGELEKQFSLSMPTADNNAT